MKKLLIGSAGIPLSTPVRNTENGVKHVKNLGLEAMELEFVRSVNISKEKAPFIKKIAGENNIILTCHGQYFVNLNSLEKAKVEASIERILNAARIANLCGAWSLCFHAAYYMERDPKKVYDTVKKHLEHIISTLKKENNKIWIRPELTGKKKQFGDLEELIRLSSELEQVLPCIDFAHSHARTGEYNSYGDFREMLEKIESKLGKQAIKNMHIHVAGIAYSEKGEKHHLNLKDSDLKYEELMMALKDFGAAGVIISESPNIEQDAILMRNTYKKLQHL